MDIIKIMSQCPADEVVRTWNWPLMSNLLTDCRLHGSLAHASMSGV